MENLAYLQLALAWESAPHAGVRKIFARPQWKNFSASSCIRCLSLGLTLAFFSIAPPTQAAIQRGDSGESVTELQQQLTDLSTYDGPLTGYFGELTEQAVIRFQRSQGISDDGIVGPVTMERLQPQNATVERTPAPRVFALGDRGPDVTELQKSLRAAGYYDGPESGYFDPLTQEAVIQFQQATGQEGDGIIGPSTLGRLQSQKATLDEASSSRVLALGDSGADVGALQKSLKAAGYYNGPEDGYFDSLTQEAVIQFQQATGKKVDGIVGPITWAELLNGDLAQQPPGGGSAIAAVSTGKGCQVATAKLASSDRWLF